ncbi:hypothetical protein SDC9_74629 [bioreactor metagenome]|uniref:Uncharacterized protein n=1 Tax=bioreactor metagenome TaxID=1076179 RepID=A0A644YI29_9ZZZZ
MPASSAAASSASESCASLVSFTSSAICGANPASSVPAAFRMRCAVICESSLCAVSLREKLRNASTSADGGAGTVWLPGVCAATCGSHCRAASSAANPLTLISSTCLRPCAQPERSGAGAEGDSSSVFSACGLAAIATTFRACHYRGCGTQLQAMERAATRHRGSAQSAMRRLIRSHAACKPIGAAFVRGGA